MSEIEAPAAGENMASQNPTDTGPKAALKLHMLNYLEANLDKNAAQNREKKEKELAQKAYGENTEPFQIVVNEGLTLEAGYYDEESEEIDPKLVFEKYPEHFWDLVKIPVTNAKAIIGEKGVALTSNTVHSNEFKIKKIKSK